jgi:hypothetical protein
MCGTRKWPTKPARSQNVSVQLVRQAVGARMSWSTIGRMATPLTVQGLVGMLRGGDCGGIVHSPPIPGNLP